MKKIFTLLVLCGLAMSISWAAEPTLKRLTPVQLAQLRLKSMSERPGTTLEVNPGTLQNRSVSVAPGKTGPALEGVEPIQLSDRDWTRLQKLPRRDLLRGTSAASIWTDEGNYDISWYDETQREFVLTTPAQLAGLAWLVSQGNSFYNTTVRLGADMDLSAYQWIPIGINYSFTGTFDGCGHTISGMVVSHVYLGGLFASLSQAEVRNVVFADDCQIDGVCTGVLAGMSYMGCVENCVSEGLVAGVNAGGLVGEADGTTFELCVANGSVFQIIQTGWTGTFSGKANNNLNDALQGVRVTVSSLEAYPDSMEISLSAYQGMNFSFGGKLGDDGLLYIPMGQYLGTTGDYALYLMGITGSTAYMDGSFVGTLSEDGLSLTISSTSVESLGVLGLVQGAETLSALEWLGLPFSLQKQPSGNWGTITGRGGSNWSQCYYRSDYDADIITHLSGTALSADEMQSSQLVETLNAYVTKKGDAAPQHSYHLWKAGTSCPVLSDEVYTAPSWGAEENYDTSWYDVNQREFVLTTAAQLAGLSRLTLDGINFRYYTIRLGADIDLSAFQWVPIGSGEYPFRGLFDGCGHTISGLHTGSNYSYAGLFGVIEYADIRHLILADDCEIEGLVAGSIAGRIDYGNVVNCRSDATVTGLTVGGLTGNAYDATLVSSIFNGQVVRQDSWSEWVGEYSAEVSSIVQGESDFALEIRILAGLANGPGSYLMVWNSYRSNASYSLWGTLGDDGCLHFPFKQQVGTYASDYPILLEGSSMTEGELIATLSADKNSITFSSTETSLVMSVYDGTELYGYIDAMMLPFNAVRQESATSASWDGLTGDPVRAVIESCYYRAGCLPTDVADTEQAVSEAELFSASLVDALNANVAKVVERDPWIESLQRWTLGADGPELSNEQESCTDWWTSEGYYDISWYDESQTDFTLSTPAQLAGLSYLVKHGQSFYDKTITLANDIDLSGHRWVPVGSVYRGFAGHFDGGGYTIHHMEVDMKPYACALGGSSAVVGLFGYWGYMVGSARNITLADDCSVKMEINPSHQGFIGSIAGNFSGDFMDNCHSSATIEVYSHSLQDTFIGGLQGFNASYLPLYNSSNRGAVTAESTVGALWVSGLVGANARITNCFNAADLSGSGPIVFVGGTSASYSTQKNVYHTGKLTAVGVQVGDEPAVAKVVPLSDPDNASLEYGYYDVSCVADTTGLNKKVVGMQPADMKSADFARLLTENATAMMSNDPNLQTLASWEIRPDENGGFPVFGDAIEVGGWWTSAGNYDISWYDASRTGFALSTPAQLAGLAYLVKNGTSFEGKSIILNNDIDLAGLKWEPIGSVSAVFMGSFDGGGYEIHNLHSEIFSGNTTLAGLFGQIYKAHVAHVVLADDCTAKSSTYTGAIVAYANNSSVVSCINRAVAELEAPSGYVGGIAGYAGGSTVIEQCENQGDVTASIQMTGNYIAYQGYAGGLVGCFADAALSNSANVGDVTVYGYAGDASAAGGIVGSSAAAEGVIMNCYNTGAVAIDKKGEVGGVLGTSTYDIRIANCYNTGSVSVAEGTAYPIARQGHQVENSYYRADCAPAEGDYQGTPMSADVMKTTSFAARLNEWSKAYNAAAPAQQVLYWKIDDGQNDGYPVFTDEDPGYSAVEAAEAGVRIYPTVVSSELYVRGADEPISFYNLAGGIALTVEPVEGVTVVDLSSLAPGVYIVRTGQHVSRIIKR